jgi:hypothetical protein
MCPVALITLNNFELFVIQVTLRIIINLLRSHKQSQIGQSGVLCVYGNEEVAGWQR